MELKATRLDVTDRIATIRLHRPNRMNAWTGRMHTEYRWCLAQADQDNDVAAIVVTGSGRAFCVGGDSEALAGHVRKGGYDPGTGELAKPGFGVAPEFDASFAYQYGLTKPLIAAVNGAAAGVGLALLCFTDIRIASADARFTTAHGKLNLPAEFGLSWVLPRMIGLTKAMDLLLSSRVFDGAEGERLGIFNETCDADEVLPRALDYARNLIATVAPGSLKQTRWQVYRDLHRDAASAVDESERLVRVMMREADYAEGVAAFLEKRKPRWKGGR